MTTPSNPPTSVLASLRDLTPSHATSMARALFVAEIQAGELRRLLKHESGAMPTSVLKFLPRLRISYATLPTSGMSHWNGHEWIISINRDEPLARQRFTIFHEYKHVIDHGRAERLSLCRTRRPRERRPRR